MRVFVTGATGFIGSRVVRELVKKEGTTVLGLCRYKEQAESLKSIGVEPVIGDVQDPEALGKVAETVDTVLHLAFIHDFSNMEKSIAVDLEVVKAFQKAIQGTNKRVVITTGTLLLGPTEPGKTADDTDERELQLHRGVVEKYAREHGMSVIRLPPFVYGHNGAGFAAMAIQFAKKDGIAAYVGDGSAKLTTVHVDDAAHGYVLAAEKAVPGHAYHIVNERVTYKDFATSIGKLVGVEPKSIPASEAPKHFPGFLSFVFSSNHEATGSRAASELGWKPTPTKPSLLDDISNGTYKA